MFTSCTCTCVDHKHREIRGDWEKGGGGWGVERDKLGYLYYFKRICMHLGNLGG